MLGLPFLVHVMIYGCKSDCVVLARFLLQALNLDVLLFISFKVQTNNFFLVKFKLYD